MIEQVVPHVKVVWFWIIMLDGEVFIKIESDYILEREAFFLVKSD